MVMNSSQLPVVFMFSGQGSQHHHMAGELFEKNSVFRECMLSLDEIAKQRLGQSVLERIYHASSSVADPFDNILYTHPAIYMVQVSLAKMVMDIGISPAYILGASLGELAAFVVGGALSIEKGLEIVIDKAKVLSGEGNRGTMIALLKDVSYFQSNPLLKSYCEIAGVNSTSHFIISVEALHRDAIIQSLIRDKVNHVVLPVHLPFHSRFVDPILDRLSNSFDGDSFTQPKLPIVSCASAQPLTQVNRDHIARVYRSPINFKQAAEFLNLQGSFYFLDLGPSGTLANLMKLNLTSRPQSITHAILTPFRQDLKAVDAMKSQLFA